MSSESHSFELDGMEDLQKDFQKMLQEYPDESEKEVFRLGGVFAKDVNTKMPTEYSSGKRPIPDSWHRTRARSSFGGYTVDIEVENTAPHWHLVENGHEVKADPAMYAAYKSGRLDHSKSKRTAKSRSKNPKLQKMGWAPGLGFCQKTRDEWENGQFAEHIDQFLKKMIKRHKL